MTTEGRFLSFEGGEGVGKTTQIALLKDWLQNQGKTVVLTREPGGTALGESIRGLLLDPQYPAMASDTELLLMFAARAEHVAKVIQPALVRGDWVISDRFADASFVYQGVGRGIDAQRLSDLAQWTLQGFAPDRTLLLDMAVEQGMERVQLRGKKDRFELEDCEFFERIRQGYLQRAVAEPARFSVIEAAHAIEDVHQRITQEVAQWI